MPPMPLPVYFRQRHRFFHEQIFVYFSRVPLLFFSACLDVRLRSAKRLPS